MVGCDGSPAGLCIVNRYVVGCDGSPTGLCIVNIYLVGWDGSPAGLCIVNTVYTWLTVMVPQLVYVL